MFQSAQAELVSAFEQAPALIYRRWNGDYQGDYKDYEADMQEAALDVLYAVVDQIRYAKKRSKADLLRLAAVRRAIRELRCADASSCPRSFAAWRRSL
jgi:hypothetical protein